MKRICVSLLLTALLLTGCDIAAPDLTVARTTDSRNVTSFIQTTASRDLPTTEPTTSAVLPVTTETVTPGIPSTEPKTESTVPDVPAEPTTGSETTNTTSEPTVPEPHEHSWGSWTVIENATCTADGSRERHCPICDTVKSETIPATGHSFDKWTTVKTATCTDEGTRCRACSICGETAESETIPATGHKWSSWTVTKAATCTAKGSRFRTCPNCKTTEKETIKATGHKWGSWTVTKAATCTEEGSREHTCSTCNTTAGETVKAAGHKWSDWTVVKEATIREEGAKYRICTTCQAKEDQVIPVYVPTEAEKKAMALAVAQEIADSIGPGTDLERVSQAARIVSYYCQNLCVYTTEGKDYRQAYGVFIKGEYSCAGSTRALGMVLECMGYKWEHVNENQWTHQWCRLVMDGQIGYADGQVGWAGYGPHPVED